MEKKEMEVSLLVLPGESDMEVYTTRPAYPNESFSTKLISNTAGTETLVYSFNLPTGIFGITNPDSDFDGILFRPYDSKGDFIDGLVNVYIKSAPLHGVRTRVYSNNTEFHNPKTPASIIRNSRKWSRKCIANAGDVIEVMFVADKVLDTSKSFVSLTLRIGKYSNIKVKLCEECIDKIKESVKDHRGES